MTHASSHQENLEMALLAAVETNDLATAASLIKHGANVNQRGPLPYTVLMIAASRGNVQMVDMLLAAGADVHAVDSSLGASALHKAAQSGVVAFKTDVSVVLTAMTARENKVKGIALFKVPSNRNCPLRILSCAPCPWRNTKGSKQSPPMATRKHAVGKAPNSAPPKRMSKNDAPQSAASKIKSRIQCILSLCLKFRSLIVGHVIVQRGY